MTCVACGADNPAGFRFCGQCAAPLEVRCASCGAALLPDQRFCGQCASPVTGGPSPSTARTSVPAPSPAAENRHVSVLFVDLIGFTTLSEQRDAEDVRELLSRYFDRARTVIVRYGGVVEKFIGDAVMAVWGAPTTREDDAERAVRAAMEIVDSVGALGAEVGADLRARAGVVTGAVAAWVAPGEGLVAGDSVNTASRVQSVAEADTVLVDETTRRATSAAIAYTDVGDHVLKGKAEPLHLWRAERVVGSIGGAQRVDGLEARFIGRDGDLRLVKELFHACVDRRSTRLVSVVGAAGVGKSRLRWELFKYIDGLVEDVWYHSGRCLSYGDGVAYSALAEMVRQRFQVAEDEPADVAAERLDAGLLEWIADPVEREFLLPRLGALLGISDAVLGREELFAGWRLLFERLAASGPVVLAFEDLHWGDSGLLDFIDHLLDWAADVPIFVVTFARPELSEVRPGWPAGRRNATSLYLEPLPPSDMAELLDDLVAGLPADLRGRIVDRSEGIPLYAVETVRSLIDRDAVVPRDGVYRLVGDVGDLDVPATLTSLLAARIDGLPPAERSLIKDLAVIGASFPRSSVAAVSGLDDDTLDELLSHLLRKEFLSVRSDKLSPDRGQYLFAQTMLRTVAYEMLSKRERKQRHLAVAAHLRDVSDDGDELAEVIAAHYRDALLATEAGAAEQQQIREQALAAYGRAGRRAAGLGAPETALGIYKTAAGLAEDEDERLRLLERAADMALQSGRHQETFDLYSRLREEHLAAGHERDWARLAVGMARGQARLGRQVDAVTTLEDALPTLEDGTYSPELAHALAWLANFLVFAGRIAEAEPHTERALVVAQALGLPDSLCQALATRATALVFLDRFDEAVLHIEAAIVLAREHKLGAQEENALITASDMAMSGDLPRALDYCNAALATLQRRGNRYGETVAASNLIYVLAFRGAFDEGLHVVEELLESGGESRPQAEYLSARAALIAAWRGDVERAQHAVERMAPLRESDLMDDSCSCDVIDAMLANITGRPADALRHARAVVDRLHVQIGLRNESFRLAWVEAIEAALALGDLDVAAELLGQVSGMPPGFVPPYLKAETARLRARLLVATGEPDEAEQLFDEACRRHAELGYPYWLARARLDRAEWLASTGRSGAAGAAEAVAAFEELGAPAWAARARRLTVQAEIPA